jgi:hypothetical protein
MRKRICSTSLREGSEMATKRATFRKSEYRGDSDMIVEFKDKKGRVLFTAGCKDERAAKRVANALNTVSWLVVS